MNLLAPTRQGLGYHWIWMVLIVYVYAGFAPADFFVAPDGNDENPGTKEAPFATLLRAQQAVRALKLQTGGLDSRVTVWLRSGDYIIHQTLTFSSEDSGTEEAPIRWRCFENERVRWLGARRLSGFVKETDPSILSRFSEETRGKVMVIDLTQQGIQNWGELQSRGFSRPCVTAHGELFFAGEPMTIARWPNVGEWELIKGFPEESGKGDDHGGTIGSLENGFFYHNSRPHQWVNPKNVWVHGYWAYDWANSYERIAELDTTNNYVRTAEPYGLYGFRPGQRFYFLNILEELDAPSEWYVDDERGKLYFWPPDQHVEEHEILFSVLETPFISFTDAAHIVVEGIIFEGSRGNAIEINGGENIQIVGCLIKNIGNWGVVIQQGKRHTVADCNIFNIGDGGVKMVGGNRQTLDSGEQVVENCHFKGIGRWSKCYVPAVLMEGVGLRASNNLIHDHPHCAILFTGNDHRIEFNDIHHIALETGDVGAIYTGRDYTFRGNRIRHNYIHETGGVGMGSMGVYMDDCVSGTEIYGNVFYKVHWAVFIGGGRDHIVENNVFVECDPAIRADARGLDRSPVWRNMVDVTMRERLFAVPLEQYRLRYPALVGLDKWYGPPEGPAIVGDDFIGVPPEGNSIVRNVCIGDWLVIAWHADPKLFDVRDNYRTKDTSSNIGPETNFALPPDSPAWALGVQPIPFDKIGLRANERRIRLEKW